MTTNVYVIFVTCTILVAVAMFICSNLALEAQNHRDYYSENLSVSYPYSTSSSSQSIPSSSQSSSSSSSSSLTPISYKVIRGLHYNNTFDPFYKCDEPEGRVSTSPMFTAKHIFDFHVQITTSYKILYMGDSVGIQFAQALQEATGAQYYGAGSESGSGSESESESTTEETRKVLRYSWRKHEGLHIASPVRGGGAVAGWRITGMFRQAQMNNHYHMPQIAGGGWMEVDLRNLRRTLALMSSSSLTLDEHGHSDTDTNTNTNTVPQQHCFKSMNTVTEVQKVVEKDQFGSFNYTDYKNYTKTKSTCPESDFDVVIHQIPFGWFHKPSNVSVTYESLHEAIELSRRHFGAKIIVLQTVPIGNNVIDIPTEMDAINNVIFNYSDTFDYNTNNNYDYDGTSQNGNNGAALRPLEAVLVMDIASLSVELFKHNAASLGLINISSTDLDGVDVSIDAQGDYDYSRIKKQLNPLLKYRTGCCHRFFPQIIGFTCAEVVANMTKYCTRTKYSMDGHHWCLKEVGGRIHGATACLLKCASEFSSSFVGTSASASSPGGNKELKSCESRCNRQYMSLKPIPFDNSGILNNY